MGCCNEATVIVDGQKAAAFIDLSAQVLTISSWFCEDLTLQMQPLGKLLELEGTAGSAIPYLGYVEVNIQIPGIKNYNKDVLLLVIPTTTYSEKVPVMAGSKIIDRAMGVITKGELIKVTMTWRQAHFGAAWMMSRAMFVLPRGLLSPYVVLSVDMAIPVLGDTEVLSGTHLFVKFKHLFCRKPH